MNPKSKNSGFTLLELIVAMALFILLGLMLVTILQTTIGIWREGESERDTFEKAQSIISYISSDLQALQPMERFFIDYDSAGHTRVRFIRTIGTQENPVLRNAGSESVEAGYNEYYTFHQDYKKKLRASGGLAEIMYTMDLTEGTRLLRAIRSPIGGSGSLFLDSNIEKQRDIEAQAHIIGDGILHFSVFSWTQFSRTWEKEYRPLANILVEANGPSLIWDSTRGILPDFFLYRKGSLKNPSDDVYPEKVKICLVIGNLPYTNIHTYLTKDLKADDSIIHVKNTDRFPGSRYPHRFIKIENEWIEYQDKTTTTFVGVRRGIWGTSPTSHSREQTLGKERSVLYGKAFFLTLNIPTYREDLSAFFSYSSK